MFPETLPYKLITNESIVSILNYSQSVCHAYRGLINKKPKFERPNEELAKDKSKNVNPFVIFQCRLQRDDRLHLCNAPITGSDCDTRTAGSRMGETEQVQFTV